ncbi:MAG TPA: superoxide dismutase [Bacteroidales bacterium]|jgi:Fe-Mn family superoxide dismutase|nr:superoxide dismutase [Bacteroidales bacterium]
MEQKIIIKKSIPGLLAALLFSTALFAGDPGTLKNNAMKKFDIHVFPALPYAYDALEPYIDARTMEIHYDKHHRAYFNNFIAAIKGTKYDQGTIEDIFAKVSEAGDAIRNNGGGFYNHVFFWNSLAPKSSGPSAELSAALEKEFGSFEKFREIFSNAAKARFGSGWAWLYMTSDKKLAVGSTPNQDNPLMDLSPVKGTPLLALDVWEHAYYLKYQNRRPEYVEAFWNVVNWEAVSLRFKEALK